MVASNANDPVLSSGDIKNTTTHDYEIKCKCKDIKLLVTVYYIFSFESI